MREDDDAATVTLTSRELATVLAALRHWQEEWNDDVDPYDEERDAATILGHFVEVTPLGTEEIDALCERLNLGPIGGGC